MPAPLAPGTVVAGQYLLRAIVGRGGMSTVYRGERVSDGQPVALKILAPTADGKLAARFVREVAHARWLDHPNCVRVIDHGEWGGHRFLCSELLAGPTLRQRLAGGPLGLRHATRVSDELLAALGHAHDIGLVHRDVKPDNAIYRRPGVDRDLVLIDFGLSRLYDDQPLTQTGTCLGSPSYLAPERLLGADCDARADLYAVGAVLYELLTGRPPFVGDSPPAIARQHLHDVPPPVALLRPDVPAALAAVVHCALAKDPGARFSHAATMRAALEDACRQSWELAAVHLATAEVRAEPPPLPAVARTPRRAACFRAEPSSELPS